VHVLVVIDHLVGHEAVAPLDAALRVGARRAEVGSVVVTRAALGFAARAAHRRHDQIARLEPGAVAHLDHLGERLVPHDQVRFTLGRHTVFEARDLVVGPADANLQHPEANLSIALDLRRRPIDDSDHLVFRKHRDCTHERSPLVEAPRLEAPLSPSCDRGRRPVTTSDGESAAR
jgi:hypothetical protein